MRNTGRSYYSSITHEGSGWLCHNEYLNTNDTDVSVPETLVELDEVDLTWERDCHTEFESQDREKEIQTQLRYI